VVDGDHAREKVERRWSGLLPAVLDGEGEREIAGERERESKKWAASSGTYPFIKYIYI
jgi:hypothetical protein